jgi:hypothetical protein
MTDFITIILSLSFSLVGIIISIECGIYLANLCPKLISKKNEINLNRGSWRLSSLIIFLSTLSAALLLRKSSLGISRAVYYFLIISLVAFLTRSLCRMYLKVNNKNVAVKWLQLVGDYVFLLSFAAIGSYILTGKQFWQSLPGVTLFVASILAIFLIGISYLNRFPALIKRPELKNLLEIVLAVWVVLLGFVYPIALAHYNVNLIGTAMTISEVVIIISILGFGYSTFFQKKPYEMYQYIILIAFLLPLLYAWNNRPYIVSLKATTRQASSISSYNESHSWLLKPLLFLLCILILLSVYILLNLLVLENIKITKPIIKKLNRK